MGNYMGKYTIYIPQLDDYVDIRQFWTWLNKTPLENYRNSRHLRR